MKKSNVVKVLRFVVKYLLPAVIGWLEGDSHTVQDFISLLF